MPDYGEYYLTNVAPYLPPATNNIKVLMTSRERPGSNISRIDLDVLSEEASLELLAALSGEERIVCDLQTKKDYPSELCQWLGYLPLGLELVGRYLKRHKTLELEKILQCLETQKLAAKSLLKPKKKDMTAQLGVVAAFELSWKELNSQTQELGCYLSLFDSYPFKWSWVENVWMTTEEAIEELEELRDDELMDRNLLKLNVIQDSQSNTEYQYQLHALIAQYFRVKLEEREQAADLKQKFCQPMIEIAKSIPETPTQQEIQAVAIAIPHLSLVATELTQYIDDENLIWPCEGLGRFYEGQGLYNQAKVWREQSLTFCRERLGEQHPSVATSLNDLSGLYQSQGRYNEAEPLLLQALELRKQLLGEQHTSVATSLNDLAGLYKSQGRYNEAEPLYIQALELRKQLLGEQHSSVAQSLNDLALLYLSQGRYNEAEPLLLQALELSKQLLGEQHPNVITSLQNLALLYLSQGRYNEAEPLLLQALELRKQVLGEQHPDVATSLNNLANLYYSQERYNKAEPLFLQALELYKQLLGERHPHVALNLHNLAVLYKSQGRYEEAEPLLLQEALEITKQLLGKRHPDVATSLSTLAGLYLSQGRYNEAESLCLQTLELRKQLLGEQHPDVASNLHNLAGLYLSQGRYNEAEPLLLQALELRKQLLGEQHPDVATSLNRLAGLYKSQGRYEEAEPLYLQALEIAEQALGENHPNTNTIRENWQYTVDFIGNKRGFWVKAISVKAFVALMSRISKSLV